jgi:hypothetical protein
VGFAHRRLQSKRYFPASSPYIAHIARIFECAEGNSAFVSAFAPDVVRLGGFLGIYVWPQILGLNRQIRNPRSSRVSSMANRPIIFAPMSNLEGHAPNLEGHNSQS